MKKVVVMVCLFMHTLCIFSMNQKKREISFEQRHFNHLVGSHNFVAAKEYMQDNPDGLRVLQGIALEQAIQRNDCTSAAFLLTEHVPYNRKHYDSVSSKKMAKLLMQRGVTQENKQELNISLVKRRIQNDPLVNSDFLRFLIFCIPDINMPIDNQKNTLLHRAVFGNNQRAADILLAHNAHPFRTNQAGSTPFDYVIETTDGCWWAGNHWNNAAVDSFNKAGMFFIRAEDGNPFDILRSSVELCHLDMKDPKDKPQQKAEQFIATLFTTITRRQALKDRPHYNHRIVSTTKGIYFFDPSFKDIEDWIGSEQTECIQHYLIRKCALMIDAMKEQSNHYISGKKYSFDGITSFEQHDSRMSTLIQMNPYVLFYDPKMVFILLRHALYACNTMVFKIKASDEHADLSGVDEDGNTLLHLALLNQHRVLDVYSALVALVKNSSVDLFKRNNKGHTAWDMAYKAENKKLFDIMREALGERIYYLAFAKKGYKAKKLIKECATADHVYVLNALTQNKQPLLGQVVREECGELCATLLKHGVRVNTEDSKGKTPLMIALNKLGEIKRFNCIVPLLLRYGATVTKDMLKIHYEHPDIRALLKNKYHAFPCCICFENFSEKEKIGCATQHEETICHDCYNGLRVKDNKKICPLCDTVFEQYWS